MNRLINILANKRLQQIVLLLLVVSAVLVLWNSNQRLELETARMGSNLQTLTASLDFVRTQNGTLAAQTNVLILRTNELTQLFPAQAKSITNLGVKISRATQVSNTVIESEKNIVTMIRDSIVHDTVRVKVFSYRDQWYRVTGISDDNSQRLQIQTTDTLTQVVFKGEREKPWLWIFSPRKLQQRVSVSNPNATIKYSSLIQIQKP